MTSIWRNCLRGVLGATAVVAFAGLARAENEAQPGAGLNPEQLKKQLLEKFDANGDGTLTGAELQNAREAALKQFGAGAGAGAAGLNFDEFKKRFDGDGDGKRFDRNGDGKLSDDEKAEAQKELKAKKGERPAGKLTEAMKKFDADDDGKLSDEEKAVAKKDLALKRKGKGKKPE